MANPTRTLYLARFTLLDEEPYTQAQLMDYFAKPLKSAGFEVLQSPSVRSYLAKYTMSREGPYPGDPDKTVFESMRIQGPDGKDKELTRDSTDPPGTRPIIERKRPYVTAVSWNLAPTKGQSAQSLADLLWDIRRKALYDSSTQLGGGWVPIVALWQSAPTNKSPYPPKPAIPRALEPKPTPPPAPAPAPAPPPPGPVVDYDPYPDYKPYEPSAGADGGKVPGWVWALAAVGGALALSQ